MSAFYTTVARFYDAETGDRIDDLRLYSELAANQKGAIFDVGCGTGRVMIHLAQDGYAVHGVENDRAMLARLEQKLRLMPHLADKLQAVCADVLEYDCQERFGLILLSYNVMMQFLSQDAQIALLARLRGLLADDGLLVIDLPNAGPVFASHDTDALTLERTFLDSETGHLVMLQSVSYLDRAAQILHIDWIYDAIDDDGKVTRLLAPNKLRYFFLPELTLLLERCGLKLDAAYGDTDLSSFDADSERMIVFAEAN